MNAYSPPSKKQRLDVNGLKEDEDGDILDLNQANSNNDEDQKKNKKPKKSKQDFVTNDEHGLQMNYLTVKCDIIDVKLADPALVKLMIITHHEEKKAFAKELTIILLKRKIKRVAHIFQELNLTQIYRVQKKRSRW